MPKYQIAIQARNRGDRTCRVRSVVVEAVDYPSAYEAALPLLLSRIEVDAEHERAGKPLPDYRPKPKPKPVKPPSKWMIPMPGFEPKPTPKAPKPPIAPRAPVASATSPRAPVAPKPPAPRAPIAEPRAPVNLAYMGMRAPRPEPVEKIHITASGLAQRKVVKPRVEDVMDIFADLLVGE